MPVKIHGKNYKMVHERLAEFHKEHEHGSVHTEMLVLEGDRCVMKATVVPDTKDGIGRMFTGHAFEDKGSSKINETSFIENCETSAIGRALAAAGYGIEEAYASANEVEQAIDQQNNAPPTPEPPRESSPAANALGTLKTQLIDDMMASRNCSREAAIKTIERAVGDTLGQGKRIATIDELVKVRATLNLESSQE